MKIIIINSYLYKRGGDCTYMFSLGELLKSKGNEVYYWGMQHPNNIIHEYKEHFPSYIDFDEINKHRNIFNGIKVLSRSIYSLEAKDKLLSFLKIIQPDIVHLNNIHAHLTPSIIDSIKQMKIPIVWTIHDYKLLCPNTHFLSSGKICEKCKGGKYYNCILNKCKKNSIFASLIVTLEAYFHQLLHINNKIDYFISPSQFLRNKFLEYRFCKHSKLKIIKHFLPNFRLQIIDNNADDYILYFGGLNKWKGVMNLIKSVAKLPNISLYIVGDGPERGNLLYYLSSNKINNVSLLGFKSGDELTKIISNSKFVITPSEWYETFGYTILESMSLQKSVIAAYIGAYPELVENANTGLLFEPGNVDDLKNKIEWLYNKPEKNKEFGNNAKVKSEKEFSSEVYYEKIIDIYKKAILGV